MKVIGMKPGFRSPIFFSVWKKSSPADTGFNKKECLPPYIPSVKQKSNEEFSNICEWDGLEYKEHSRPDGSPNNDVILKNYALESKKIDKELLAFWFAYFYQDPDPLKKRHNMNRTLSEWQKVFLKIFYLARKAIIENSGRKTYRKWKEEYSFVPTMLKRLGINDYEDLSSEYWLYLCERAARNEIDEIKSLTVDFKSTFIQKLIERSNAVEKAEDVLLLDDLYYENDRDAERTAMSADNEEMGDYENTDEFIDDIVENQEIPSSLISRGEENILAGEIEAVEQLAVNSIIENKDKLHEICNSNTGNGVLHIARGERNSRNAGRATDSTGCLSIRPRKSKVS